LLQLAKQFCRSLRYMPCSSSALASRLRVCVSKSTRACAAAQAANRAALDAAAIAFTAVVPQTAASRQVLRHRWRVRAPFHIGRTRGAQDMVGQRVFE
jgi:hypothetical protein